MVFHASDEGDKRDSRSVRGVVLVACCRRHYNARLVRLLELGGIPNLSNGLRDHP